MSVLTLASPGLEEHPIEVARRALIAAADEEGELLADALRLVAASLPRRCPRPPLQDLDGGA